MRFRQKVIVVIILVAIIGLALMSTLVHLLTELWWFEAVGFDDVFWTRITWQIAIWLLTLVIFGAFLWFNYWLASRLTSDRHFRIFQGSDLEPLSKTISNLIALLFIFIIAFGAANSSVGFWETSLKFLHATDFNLSDPIYQKDIGFYIFQFPFYRGLQHWLFNLFVIGLIFSLTVYLLKGIFKFDVSNQRARLEDEWQDYYIPERHRLEAQSPKYLPSQQQRLELQWQHHHQEKQKAHISLLLAAIAMTVAVDFWLKRYELLYSPHGVVWGAGYTDIHAKLFAYGVMGIGALILGVFFILAIWAHQWSRKITLPLYGIAIYFIVLVLVNGILPQLQQQLIVAPNELDKEQPYIKHNIELTRQAYNLEAIAVKDYPVFNQLTPEKLQQAQGTIQNIRLWDYRPLLSTYRQLQEIRPYYQFNDVDIDRYTLNGTYRQIMLSARELSYERVPEQAQTWVNQRLKYTHGYGVVMSPVNQVTADGFPVFFLRNIPPVSQVDLEVKEPAIYYGEESDRYIFTGTKTQEFDYPQGSSNVFTDYQGKGGVPIPTIWHRLAYAYDLHSLKILISNYFTQNSRIHYYRNILQRVSHVAPFLQFDHDPYITVIDGKLKWIIDAYTTSDRYPYAEPVFDRSQTGFKTNKINYIRNTVKVIVDAKDGTMQFIVVDEQEPVLATYRQIFPHLFQGAETVTSEVKKHFRYASDLFKIQAQMYLSYHMDDPQVFYNREDLWRLATENYEGSQQAIEPYYQIMTLQGESQEEYLLIVPFNPVNKDNMIAWMAARCDGENYGKLLLYTFPKQELIYGPFQIEARIDQNPEISQQLTLWSQEGSRVIRGNLLVIPINGSLLYVEPVYLRAEQGQLPELKRVIVAYDKEVVMRPTLEESLQAILGTSTTTIDETEVEIPPASTLTETDYQLIKQASIIFQKAESAMREGNWAEYGRYQQQLKDIFQQLEDK